MAVQQLTWKSRWDAFWASHTADRFRTSWGLPIGLTVIFFLLTLIVYHLTSPGPTAFNAPVRLADALLHGRLDIAEGPDLHYMDWAVHKGKYYIIEPPMPSIVMLPGVLLFGVALNQTLVSLVIGSITAGSVYALMRKLTGSISVQVSLTLLFVLGTVYWYYAVSGYVTHIAHALAVLFLFLAIYEAIHGRRPFLVGLLLGAAYWSRLPTILALPFFIIMYSDKWLLKNDEQPLLKRIDIKPLAQLGLGVGIFVLLSFAYNYLRFEDPWHVSYSLYVSQTRQPASFYPDGLFNISYIPDHLAVVFRNMPIILREAPYIVPSWAGMAFWATTPAFVYALFAGVRTKRVQLLGLALLFMGVIVALVFARGMPGFINRFSRDFPEGLNLPLNLELFPFVLLIALAVWTGFRNRDKLVLACWAAIIPIALTHFTYGATPPQLGYRWALDYYPFFFVLMAIGIGHKIRWHHMTLIALAIAVNLWGVLWIHQFSANGFLELQWVRW